MGSRHPTLFLSVFRNECKRKKEVALGPALALGSGCDDVGWMEMRLIEPLQIDSILAVNYKKLKKTFATHFDIVLQCELLLLRKAEWWIRFFRVNVWLSFGVGGRFIRFDFILLPWYTYFF